MIFARGRRPASRACLGEILGAVDRGARLDREGGTRLDKDCLAHDIGIIGGPRGVRGDVGGHLDISSMSFGDKGCEQTECRDGRGYVSHGILGSLGFWGKYFRLKVE
ncbi:MAG: hypothetical protein R3F11_26000 [Verrucomicrobiales bacterium]